MGKKKSPDDLANDIQRYADHSRSDTSDKKTVAATSDSNSDDPLTMLKKQLIKKEISKEEFEEMKKLIE